ncbi:MAG: hypothetical protein A3A86_03110 [Elusimicrobia bacterium RIFCSPLOWO2_01_FULL_60_11]|nr:MAG: hypothetical protein A3A86_03110 [Elusimicrobia bacterium RIFCSPLOWO2_01_FULL_60_11]
MIFLRFESHGEAQYGVIDRHDITPISPHPFGPYEETDDPIPLAEVRLLAPVAPGKIVAVGMNYKAHVKEMGREIPEEPVLFMKPPSGVIGSQDAILYPKMSTHVDYEAELAVVIKKKAKDVAEKDALDFVFGYTCFNDVTARDLQKKDNQWTRAKGFDTFAPIGPWIVTDLDPGHLPIECHLNGAVKQKGNTRDMIFSVPYLVSFISRVMTLEPGDVIATGTPPGIGPMQTGDRVDVSIEGIGVLRNTVEAGT